MRDMSGRKLARRACDGCKIRKIKCSETSPCNGCQNAGIACTWLKQSQPRGPRRLRDATLQEIRKAQDILQTQAREAAPTGTTRSAKVNDPDPPPQPSSEVAQLVLYLCVYRVKLYPIWPIIKVERLIASLQSENSDVEVFALAYALAAATATRTQSTDLSVSRGNHAHVLEGRCQAARGKVPPGRPPNLTTVRIAFFLHIYYESLEANSMKSMLYLREAVTIATMIGLHKESYYLEVPDQEREIRRRVLWLLFVTERVISVLYEQPFTLRTKIELPSTTDSDEVDVLAGFQLLVRLFSRLDESGFFSLLDELEFQTTPNSNDQGSRTSTTWTDFATLIQADSAHSGYIPPVQKLDLAVSRCWLHITNLRVRQAALAEPITGEDQATNKLLSALEGMVEAVETSPYALVEAHGFALQLKISTISGSLPELLRSAASQPTHPDVHTRYSTLFQRLGQAFNETIDTASNPLASTPYGPIRSSPHSATSLPSPKCAFSTYPVQNSSSAYVTYERDFASNGALLASSSDDVSASQYLCQDFAVDNNYEGLFKAVELAGVRSSDAVNDLFDQASLDHYTNFDDTWPCVQHSENTPNISHLW